MRIYIAAPWDHRGSAAAAAELFERAGHVITHKWWNHTSVAAYPGPAKGKDLSELRKQADADLAGVLSARTLVVLQLAKSEGKAFEQGLAASANIPVVVVSPGGVRGHLFQYLPDYTFVETVEEAVAALVP